MLSPKHLSYFTKFRRIFSTDTKQIIKTRQDKMSPTYATFQTFKDPVVINKASGQYCYGPNDEKYLDLLAHNLNISFGQNSAIELIIKLINIRLYNSFK